MYSSTGEGVALDLGGATFYSSLKIVDTKNVKHGLVFQGDGKVPMFVRVSRKMVLSMTGMESKPVSSHFCESLRHGYKTQRSSLYRG